MTCTSDTRSRSPSPRTKPYEMESSVIAITFSVASGGPQSANIYPGPGGHQVSTVQDACAVAVMHDTGTQSTMTLIVIFSKQFNSVHRLFSIDLSQQVVC